MLYVNDRLVIIIVTSIFLVMYCWYYYYYYERSKFGYIFGEDLNRE